MPSSVLNLEAIMMKKAISHGPGSCRENSVMAVSCPYLDLLQRGQGKNHLWLWSTVTASKSIGVDLALLLSHCWKFIEDWKEMGQR